MADSSIAVTAGSGTSIDTRTEGTNGNHRQVVVLGDPATNAGVAPVDATAGLKVNLGADNDVTVTGTATVSGPAAHDAAVSGNPVLNGLEARTSEGTAVASGDVVRAISDVMGKQVVLPYSIPENVISGATAAITDTTSTSIIAAQGASVRAYITSLLVTNSHATVGTLVSIKDGSGGTTLYAGYAAPAGGGFSVTFPTPIKTTANTALHALCGTTGSNIYVSASGYKGA